MADTGRFQVVPAVDVLDGSVVRLLRGDFAEVTEYAADPIAMVETWAGAGAQLVHVVDLGGAKGGEPDRALWARLGASGVAVQVGGGIRTVESAEAAVASGVARIVVGTAAVWEPELLRRMVDAVGSERLVAALDVKDGMATGSGWVDAGRPVAEVAAAAAATGVRHALVTGISRDGTMEGPDLDVMSQVVAAAPDVAVLASGGVGSLADLQQIAAAGFAGAIVGRALYEGRFTFAEALAAVG